MAVAGLGVIVAVMVMTMVGVVVRVVRRGRQWRVRAVQRAARVVLLAGMSVMVRVLIAMSMIVRVMCVSHVPL